MSWRGYPLCVFSNCSPWVRSEGAYNLRCWENLLEFASSGTLQTNASIVPDDEFNFEPENGALMDVDLWSRNFATPSS